jgi:hydrogenase nickel incorporation protein HypA/HybF
MHELAVTQSIVDAVAERFEGVKVSGIRLEIGKLSGVAPDSVRFCFDLVTEGTTLAGARLDIDEPAGRALCGDCGSEFELEVPIPLCRCGSAGARIVAGDQLRILSVEVT